MDEARSVVSRTLNQFGEGHSGEVEGLQTAKDALFADPSLVQEFGGQLEQQASSSGPAACIWLAEIYSNAAVHSPSTELLTSGLRAAERLLARPETADAGLALGSNLIHALFQDPKLCFSGEKLWEAFHGTAESVSKLFDGTPTHSRVRAVKLMQDILLLLTSPASLKGSALGKPASKVAGQVQRYLKQLLALLRMAKSGGQNSVLTLAAIQAAQQTVLKRPGQAGRILPSLLALATASFSGAQKAGIQKCLRGGLLAMWGVDAPALKAWKPKVATALGSLGVRVEGSPPNDKRALNQAVRPEDPQMVANKSREQSPGSEAALQISSGARQQQPHQPAAQQQGVADPGLDAPLLHAPQGALPAPAPVGLQRRH